MTERLHLPFSCSCIGERNGNPLQCSCLENPRDGEAWWAAVYGVAQSRTRLKPLSSSNMALISISLISDVLKYLFKWLLAIYLSSSGNTFVYSVVIFLIFFIFSRPNSLPMTCWDIYLPSIMTCLFYTLFRALWWTGTLNSYRRKICLSFFFIFITFLYLVLEILLSSKVIEIIKNFLLRTLKFCFQPLGSW